MKIETKEGLMLISSERTASVIRIERASIDRLMISLASRDEDGQMRIESSFVSISQLQAIQEMRPQ